ncbi:ABC-2 type transport system ATP-binding protein [Ruminococcus flavefaciens]|uniref:ABC-2 type transport system ATP-binding protein n=1 Tax=Ruminococcus flavefaciens TaxID=1265 RepID=A0A1H6K258_RUMFL|nr:ABC transporter ATP-binding protein [Ruminococcus flavefaciens]SEH69330.1 ABC-2 type transport system ATP-binding protein [Ruminococcus flavefaciens]
MIELKNTVKKFDGFTALDEVDLRIEKGTAFGLLGSNGAGKSTILRLVSGIYSADSGEVLVDGESVYDNADAKQKIFFINDETVQFGSFTLKKLKNYYKVFYPSFSEEIFESLRKKTGLPLDKKINTFSKGMKRQAIVIIGLACRTDYLLLDEAFDGLDPTMRIIVKKMLVDAMLDRQLTTIISSHNLKEINEVCDTAALLHNGKIVFSRDIDDIKGSIHKIQVVFNKNEDGSVVNYTEEDFVQEDIEILHYEQSQSICFIIAKGDIDAIKASLLSKHPMLTEVIPLTLEEIFIYELEVLGYDSSDNNESE